jgi:hypothetical protein
MNTVDRSRKLLFSLSRRCPILWLGAICLTWAITGCADNYGPGYGSRYYAGSGYYGSSGYYGRPGYGYRGYGYPGYGYPGYGYGSSVSVAVGDRPYYVHGPGYYAGRSYYVWKPGHWAVRHGRKVWIHGHYVLRG